MGAINGILMGVYAVVSGLFTANYFCKGHKIFIAANVYTRVGISGTTAKSKTFFNIAFGLFSKVNHIYME